MTSSSIPLPTTRIYMYIYTYISALHRQTLITISPPSTVALLTCMMENKLKLNPDKTEELNIGPRQHISTVSSSSRQPVWHHDSLLESVRLSLRATLSTQPTFVSFVFISDTSPLSSHWYQHQLSPIFSLPSSPSRLRPIPSATHTLQLSIPRTLLTTQSFSSIVALLKLTQAVQLFTMNAKPFNYFQGISAIYKSHKHKEWKYGDIKEDFLQKWLQRQTFIFKEELWS